MRCAALGLALVGSAACSEEAAPVVGPASGAGGATLVSVGAGAASGDGCADEARAVYLLAKDRTLMRFDPATLAIDDIGKLNCPAQGGPAVGIPTPFSMAVDRTGGGWVHYNDGSLFRIDVSTADCEGTGFQTEQLSAFKKFGMGFVSQAPGSQDETLFLSSYEPGDGIAALDLTTLKVERVGYYDDPGGPAELTGTGDARLYAFFLGNPVRVAEIGTESSDIFAPVSLPTLSIGQAWAFAFWGDEFWMFTAPDGETSRIDKLRRGESAPVAVLDDVGRLVVGAGVSTCAPVELPK